MPIPQIDLDRVPAEHRQEAERLLVELEAVYRANPLEFWEPHCASQRQFMAAVTRIVAAFAGNRWGKTTALTIKVLCQLLPDEHLPAHLRGYRQVSAPCHGWIVCPSEEKIFDTMLPAIDKWCPKAGLHGGSRAKAWNGERKMLLFENGSTLAFKTYRQDVGTLGGADLDFVGYDEPPPKAHRNECLARMARGVREWYAMTPVRVNVAWIRRDIWMRRESPDITVVSGSIHENVTLKADEVQFILGEYDATERESREHGAFMDLAGLVYSAFGSVTVPPPTREFVGTLERVVGIDPGIRNAAVVFGGFDQHGVDWVFDELLIRDGTPSDYVAGIDRVLAGWGLTRADAMFVIDPAARQRSQATGDTVQSELTRLGLHTMNGIRNREAGQQQVRDRIKHGRLKVSEACVGLRDEAEDFAYPLTEPGRDESIGPADDSPYHRLATLRYQVMARPWYPAVEAAAVDRNLGWVPGRALDPRLLRAQPRVGPMGPLS